MTIGKKLYAGFGLILGILLLLFFVNLFAGWMEKSARTNAGTALESVRTIESVRYQIMLNRLNMNNFLLSGDPRDEDRVTRGLNDITDIIKRGESQATNETVRTALIRVTPPFLTCKFSIFKKTPLLGSRNPRWFSIKATRISPSSCKIPPTRRIVRLPLALLPRSWEH